MITITTFEKECQENNIKLFIKGNIIRYYYCVLIIVIWDFLKYDGPYVKSDIYITIL